MRSMPSPSSSYGRCKGSSGFEKKAKKLISDWTGMQTVCGHSSPAKSIPTTGSQRSPERSTHSDHQRLLNAVKIGAGKGHRDSSRDRQRRRKPDVGRRSRPEAGRSKPCSAGPPQNVAGGLHLTGRKLRHHSRAHGRHYERHRRRERRPSETGIGRRKMSANWQTGMQSILIDTVKPGQTQSVPSGTLPKTAWS